MKRLFGVLALSLTLLGAVFYTTESSLLLGRYENTWMFQGAVDGNGSEVAKLVYTVWTPLGFGGSCEDDGPDWTLYCYQNAHYDIQDCPISGYITFETWVGHTQDFVKFYHGVSCDDPDPEA